MPGKLFAGIIMLVWQRTKEGIGGLPLDLVTQELCWSGCFHLSNEVAIASWVLYKINTKTNKNTKSKKSKKLEQII